jgi:O-antigen/teichoic acid export membrane protein
MLKRNLIANYLGQGWVALMSLAFIPLYIKYLGIEAYGLIGLFAVLQAWLALLDMGMTPTLSREMARFSGGVRDVQSICDLLRTIEFLALIVAIVIVFGIWISSDWLASNWLKADKLPVGTVAHAFSLMGVVTALRFLEGIYRSSLVGLQRQVFFNVINSIMATLRGAGAVVVLVFYAKTIDAFFIWQGVVSLLMVVALGAITYSALPEATRYARFSIDSLRGIKRFAGGVMATTLLALMLTQIDKILLSKLMTLQDFGYYALAGSVAGGLSMFIGPVAQAAYPNMSKLVAQHNESSLLSVYHTSTQLLAVLLIPIVLTVSFYAYETIYVWAGDLTLAKKTSSILSALVIGTLLNGIMTIPYMLQLAYGWTSFAVKLNIMAVLVLIPAIFIAVPKFGGLGAAWMWLLLNTGYITFGIHFMHRRLLPSEKWRWYINDLLVPTLGAIGVLLILSPLHPNLENGRIAWLLFIAANAFTAIVAAAFMASQIRPRILALKKVFLQH